MVFIYKQTFYYMYWSILYDSFSVLLYKTLLPANMTKFIHIAGMQVHPIYVSSMILSLTSVLIMMQLFYKFLA